MDPVTYIVDLIRYVLTGVRYFDITLDILVVAAFILAANIVGVIAFERMKA